MSTRRAWNGIAALLDEDERRRITQEVERSGRSFDTVVLEIVRRGLAHQRYCGRCGSKL